MGLLEIHPDIAQAETPPAHFYTDCAMFKFLVARVLTRSWHFVGDASQAADALSVHPFTLLPGCLDEPLVLVRDRGNVLRCLSNVCTHRGTVVVEQPGRCGHSLRCRYHGRRFGLDGRFEHMPEFEGCANFPAESDNLCQVSMREWRGLRFVSLNPAHDFNAMTAELERRVGWLPVETFKRSPAHCRDYTVKAHWALYCDNYLEGLHVPFVHATLNQALDYGEYATELHDHNVLQVGIARAGEPHFTPPAGHPDHGKHVAAWYFWLFPCTMLNFYPWGLSVNVIEPLGPELTRVRFMSYVHDATRLETGAGAGLDRVEQEDEAVVEAVQQGLKGRFYTRGRYSPTRETGTHYFHRLLAALVNH
jgi:choline monooxygenase